MDLTGIQNIGEFYSHHYLEALLENDLKGLLARWRDEDETTPDRRLNRLGTEYFKAKSQARPELALESRYEPSHRLHVALLEALGYPYTFEPRYLNGKLAVPVLSALLRDGRAYLWIVETPFPGKDELAEADASPFDQRLFRRQYPPAAAWGEADYLLPEGRWEDLIGEIFHADEPPRWLLLLAGRYVYLVDRTKWGRGQYLLFDLDEIMGRRQAQTLRAAAALLSKEALCPDEGIPLHDTLDENSHKHAYGVSSDLKYGVRRAVELLGNEYVWYQRSVAKQALFQDEDLARKLTNEALTYLYRLLFLLYAEARGSELEVAPVKAEAYLKGYSLEALRDLEQAPLTTPQAQNGYFLNDSLNRLFSLVDEGHNPQQLAFDTSNGLPTAYDDYGFRMQGLHSPLFNRQSTPLLSAVRFRNCILQEVIQLLSLSRQRKGRKAQRGRISYAQLGINQLGAVYEALLSYSGFFASEDLYEVKPAEAKEADETAQTYFIPASELERYRPEEFVYDGETGQRKRYPKGAFIFRLAGRDREKSASYYTPEVLTQCVVKYSLKELLKDKTADQVLGLTICEPAMGSGAFINEALNQLADAYLERKQQELGQKIAPDDYRLERQKVKYSLAVNNAYGVDLNPTAVRLAEVSLWLNILYPGAPTPWFGGRLAAGNSLIGGRRQVYSVEEVRSGAYKEMAPHPRPLRPSPPAPLPADGVRPGERGEEDGIFHWLLPDAGMAAFDKDQVIKELAPTQVAAIKKWRGEFTRAFSAAELRNLQALSQRAEALWQKALEERLTFVEQVRQPVAVWGQPEPPPARLSSAQAEKALAWLRRPSGPYARLKLAMDYWCALWFWPIPEAARLPARQQYLEDIAAVFAAGEESGFEKAPEQLALFAAPQPRQAGFADLKPLSLESLCAANPRLALARDVTDAQRFHHWELVFIEIFAKRGGFDLLVGNPPWIKVKWDESGILSEFDPCIVVRGYDSAKASSFRSKILSSDWKINEYTSDFVGQIGLQAFLSTPTLYHLISQVQTNLYKAFLVIKWWLSNTGGVSALLHDYGVYDDPSGDELRKEIYKRLRWVFRFYNELNLFPEESLGHAGQYCVSIFSNIQSQTDGFYMMANLFHPVTIDESIFHDGHGSMPGIKTSGGKWELRGHAKRIVQIKEKELFLFARLYGVMDELAYGIPLPIIHGSNVLHILETLSCIKPKLSDFEGKYYSTVMYEEKKGLNSGLFIREVAYPVSVKEWVLSGPHYYVGNPYAKNPRENCQSKGDYDEIDLTEIADTFIPRTMYRPTDRISNSIPAYLNQPITTRFRYVNRKMAQPSNERTLISAIIPPDVIHINSSLSISFEDDKLLCQFTGLTCSVVYDFFIRVTGKQNIMDDVLRLLPLPVNTPKGLSARTLRLNCISIFYSDLWKGLYTPDFNLECWSKTDIRLKPWTNLTPHWQRDVALRTPFERRQALVEIDVLAALALGLTLDELLTIYRVQFPVLQKNERRLRFDQRGMEVPVRSAGGELVVDEASPRFEGMVPPFTGVEREDDYRVAWKFFEERVKGKNKSMNNQNQSQSGDIL